MVFEGGKDEEKSGGEEKAGVSWVEGKGDGRGRRMTFEQREDRQQRRRRRIIGCGSGGG